MIRKIMGEEYHRNDEENEGQSVARGKATQAWEKAAETAEIEVNLESPMVAAYFGSSRENIHTSDEPTHLPSLPGTVETV